MDEHGGSVVKPVAVDQDDLLQKPELGEGEVGRPNGCPALLAHDAEPNMRLLDHGDVITAVADSGCDWFEGRIFHHLDNLGLL